MRGRKPTPTALHKVKGTFNVTRHGKDRTGEPVASGNLGGEPPEWMSEAQKAGWSYTVQHAPAGVMKQIDAGVLAVWVVAEEQHRSAVVAQAKLDATTSLPMLTKDKNGQPVQSPYLGIINRAALRMIKAASELGFSPAARPRLSSDAAGGGTESPWAQFEVINGGRAAG